MRYIKVLFVLLVFSLLFKPLTAVAQQCDVIPATITTMTEPDIGAFNLWDKVHGAYPAKEVFVDAISDPRMGITLVGTYQSVDGRPIALLLAHLDHRGRPIWEHIHDIPGLRSVSGIEPHADGFVVLATVNEGVQKQSTKIWFGRFDKTGKPLGVRTISDSQGGAFADDLLAIDDGRDGYILSSHIVKSGDQFFTKVYALKPDGKPEIERAYRSGANNRIYSLFKGHNDQIIGVGKTQDIYSRPTGWVVTLDKNMRIAWEQDYPRGFSSDLRSGLKYFDNTLVVMGDATPIGRGAKAAWIMLIEANGGESIWERYYRGTRDYSSVTAVKAPDGVLSVVINGANHPALEEKNKVSDTVLFDFVRTLTLNKRGVVLGNEDYLNSHGVQAAKIFSGPQDVRYLLGDTMSEDTIDNVTSIPPGTSLLVPDAPEDSSEKLPVSQNGWFLAVPGTEPYDDPCQSRLDTIDTGP